MTEAYSKRHPPKQGDIVLYDGKEWDVIYAGVSSDYVLDGVWLVGQIGCVPYHEIFRRESREGERSDG